MGLDLPKLWNPIGWGRKPAARRRRTMPNGTSLENLESRCLLSVTMSGGVELAADCDVTPQIEEGEAPSTRLGRKAPSTAYPDLTGHWSIITHTDGADVHGTLDLTQKGRKVTGTFKNDLQPPEKFTAKFEKAPKQKVDPVTGKIKGKTKNRSIDSDTIFFIADVVASVEDARIDGKFKGKDGEVLFNAVRLLHP